MKQAGSWYKSGT